MLWPYWVPPKAPTQAEDKAQQHPGSWLLYGNLCQKILNGLKKNKNNLALMP